MHKGYSVTRQLTMDGPMDTDDSGRTTPATSVNEEDEPSRPQSSPPTSPMEPNLAKEGAADAEIDEEDKTNGGMELNPPTEAVDEEDDMEGMDAKARALTNLLKTSSVSCAPAWSTCEPEQLTRCH